MSLYMSLFSAGHKNTRPRTQNRINDRLTARRPLI